MLIFRHRIEDPLVEEIERSAVGNQGALVTGDGEGDACRIDLVIPECVCKQCRIIAMKCQCIDHVVGNIGGQSQRRDGDQFLSDFIPAACITAHLHQ